jgi:hypothetical protein
MYIVEMKVAQEKVQLKRLRRVGAHVAEPSSDGNASDMAEDALQLHQRALAGGILRSWVR